MHKLLILLAVTFCISSASYNYHERRLYYNEGDNCCIHDDSDQVAIEVTFNDRPKVQKTISGRTYCVPFFIFYQDKVDPADYMIYQQCYPDQSCDKITFDQKTTYQKVGLKITSIVQKATIQNPTKFDKNQYNCVIDGDGSVQHFGPIGSVPAPKMLVNCTRITSNIRTEAS